jgi:hypothetical protein
MFFIEPSQTVQDPLPIIVLTRHADGGATSRRDPLSAALFPSFAVGKE